MLEVKEDKIMVKEQVCNECLLNYLSYQQSERELSSVAQKLSDLGYAFSLSDRGCLSVQLPAGLSSQDFEMKFCSCGRSFDILLEKQNRKALSTV